MTRFEYMALAAALALALVLAPGPAPGQDEIHRVRVENLTPHHTVARLYRMPDRFVCGEYELDREPGPWTNVPSGTYFVLVRYGPMPPGSGEPEFVYFKGGEFTLRAPPGQYVEVRVLLGFRDMDIELQGK